METAILRNRFLRNYLQAYSQEQWPEVTKLILILGVQSLQKAGYGTSKPNATMGQLQAMCEQNELLIAAADLLPDVAEGMKALNATLGNIQERLDLPPSLLANEAKREVRQTKKKPKEEEVLHDDLVTTKYLHVASTGPYYSRSQVASLIEQHQEEKKKTKKQHKKTKNVPSRVGEDIRAFKRRQREARKAKVVHQPPPQPKREPQVIPRPKAFWLDLKEANPSLPPQKEEHNERWWEKEVSYPAPRRKTSVVDIAGKFLEDPWMQAL